jgi:flagellar basal-body rod protein FlgB
MDARRRPLGAGQYPPGTGSAGVRAGSDAPIDVGAPPLSSFAIGDVTMDSIFEAMQGLTARQDAIANNMANLQTPGYTAQNVDFESSLQQAIAAGNPSEATISVTPSDATPQTNGNNVNLDDETVTAMQTQESYQTMVDAMNNKFQLLTDAIGSGS